MPHTETLATLSRSTREAGRRDPAGSAADGLVSFAELAARIGDELGDLAGMADALQDLIAAGGLVEPDDHRAIASAQNFDLLIQRLEGLKRFIEDLGPTVSPDLRFDAATAARGLTLQRMRDRLSFAAAPAEEDTDFELF